MFSPDVASRWQPIEAGKARFHEIRAVQNIFFASKNHPVRIDLLGTRLAPQWQGGHKSRTCRGLSDTQSAGRTVPSPTALAESIKSFKRDYVYLHALPRIAQRAGG